jgi:hypothetical protein
MQESWLTDRDKRRLRSPLFVLGGLTVLALCGRALFALIVGADWTFGVLLLSAGIILAAEAVGIWALKRRSFLSFLTLFFAGLIGFAATILGLGGLVFGIYNPDLARDKAAQILTARPELNRIGSLVLVSDTTRSRYSLDNTHYTAIFFFVPYETATPVKAFAVFQYDDGD